VIESQEPRQRINACDDYHDDLFSWKNINSFGYAQSAYFYLIIGRKEGKTKNVGRVLVCLHHRILEVVYM
jgi:hypothetical protein